MKTLAKDKKVDIRVTSNILYKSTSHLKVLKIAFVYYCLRNLWMLIFQFLPTGFKRSQ
jgi:hypothetical protein